MPLNTFIAMAAGLWLSAVLIKGWQPDCSPGLCGSMWAQTLATVALPLGLGLCKRLGGPCWLGFAAAAVTGALQVTVPLTQALHTRITEECHGQQVNFTGQWEAQSLTATDEVRLSLRAMSETTPCLKPGALVSVSSPVSALPANAKPGDTLAVPLGLAAPHYALPLQGFDAQWHGLTEGRAGHGRPKGPMLLTDQRPGWMPGYWAEQARWAVTQRINAHPWTGSSKATLIALVTGDQGQISVEDRQLYALTGVAHLLAISGLHITLLAFLVSALLIAGMKRVRNPSSPISAQAIGHSLGFLAALGYALFTGWSAPAQRTVVMLGLWQLHRLLGRHTSPWDIWVKSILVCVWLDPFAWWDLGFQLSFGAVGVLILGHHNRIHLQPCLPAWLASALQAQWVVTLGMLVPTAVLFNQQSLLSPIANALSIPWVSWVSTPLALLGGLFNQSWAIALAAKTLDWHHGWLVWLSAWAPNAWAVPAQPWWVYTLALVGCIGLCLPKGVLPRWFCIALLGLLLWPPPRPAEGEFWLTALDVGQGTAVAIQTRHHLLVYDTGAAKTPRSDQGLRTIHPWLQAQGHQHIDVLWLSHADGDHTGGAASLLSLHPTQRWVSPMPDDLPLMRTLKHAAQQQGSDMNHQPCSTMKAWTWEGIRFEPLTTPVQQGDSDNDQSCVLKVSNHAHSVLLTGDIELRAEKRLTEYWPAKVLRSTVLVVPHHGSKTSSTPAFLDAVQPSTAIIQSGWKNSYGHPHPEVMARYTSRGINLLNTAQVGAIQMKFPSNQMPASTCTAVRFRGQYWHMHKSGAHPDEHC